MWRVPIPNRYTAKAKLCFCKNNKRRIIMAACHQLRWAMSALSFLIRTRIRPRRSSKTLHTSQTCKTSTGSALAGVRVTRTKRKAFLCTEAPQPSAYWRCDKLVGVDVRVLTLWSGETLLIPLTPSLLQKSWVDCLNVDKFTDHSGFTNTKLCQRALTEFMS